MSPARRATFVLILLCVIWGSSFFSMDLALDGLETEVGKTAAPLAFLLVRFAIATALLPLMFPRSVRELTRASVFSGTILAVPFVIGFMLQVAGLGYTTPTISAFITSLAVLFTPVLGRMFFGETLSFSNLAGAAIAFAGIAVMTNPTGGGFGTGELLTLGAVIAFTFQIQMTNVVTSRHSPEAVTLVMFVVGLVASAAGVLYLGVPLRSLARGLAAPHVAWSAVYNAVLCSVVANVLMNRHQKDLTPTRAAVIYTLEPALAAGFSAVFIGEPMTARKILGGAIVVAGNLACELLRKREVSRAPVTSVEPGPSAPPGSSP
jgi:drug/metabolite transporter (DMT)-like permease